jgi:hypothetical protein
MATTLLVVFAAAAAAAYCFSVGRSFARCAPTAEDLARPMAGDAVIANPTHSATDAVTINAPPQDIWPWLVQLGYQRGGLYSYDWLDRLFGFLDRPSATRVLAEFQRLSVGDSIRLGPRQELTVVALEPARALALRYERRGFEWVWQFGLYPLDENRTRLLSRGSERFDRNIATWLFMQVMKPAAFIMTRRMLLGLKARAETLRRERPQQGTSGGAADQAHATAR